MKACPRPLVRRCCWLAAAALLTALLSSRAVATIEYARLTGQPCSTCHVRPEGGGELTSTGASYARSGYQWPVPESVEAYTPSNLVRILKLIAGYLHLAGTVVWFGTIFYIHIVVRPQRLTTGIPRAEGTIGWISIGVMFVTGGALTVFRHLETGSVFVGTFGTVFIVKLIQFGIMVILAFVATVVLSRRLRQPGRQAVPPSSSSGAMTLEALASYDGEDDRRGIVAVEGKLYDVTDSRMWPGGFHLRKHRAGQDLTAALKGAPHGAEVLDRVPMIGELIASSEKAERRPPSARTIFVAFTYVNLALMFGVLLCVAWWKWGF